MRFPLNSGNLPISKNRLVKKVIARATLPAVTNLGKNTLKTCELKCSIFIRNTRKIVPNLRSMK